MDKFEQQFEHLDVQSSYMEQAMSDTTTLTVPQVGQQFVSTLFVYQKTAWVPANDITQTMF